MDKLMRAFLFFLVFFCSLWPYHYVPDNFVDNLGLPVFLVHFFPELLIFVLGSISFFFRRKDFFGKKIDLFLFLNIAFLGSLGGEYWVAYSARMVNYFVISILLSWLTSLYICKFRDIYLFALIVSISVFIVSGYGMLEFGFKKNLLFEGLFGPDNMTHFRFVRGNVQNEFRIYGTLGSPVYLGTFLVMCLPWCWYLQSWSNTILTKYFARIALLMGSIALLFTFSRGAWLGIVGAGVCYMIFRNVHVRVFGRVAVIGGVLLLSVIAMTDFEHLAVRRGLFDEIYNYQSHGRTKAYFQATQMALGSPFWGSGVGSYRTLAPVYGDDDHTPDNMYLRLLVETGVFGFLFFVTFYFRMLRKLKHYITKHLVGFKSDMALTFFMIFIGFAINISFCDALYFPPTRIIFWMCVGICFGFSSHNSTETARVLV